MNHNFLPYEVCCMLPEINPYIPNNTVLKYRYCTLNNRGFKEMVKSKDKGKYPFKKFLNIPIHLGKPLHFKTILRQVRDAWTIIDALQWLEDEHNIIILMTVEKEENKHLYLYHVNKGLSVIRDNIWYNSRTEAYIQGIKEALKLIQDETIR